MKILRPASNRPGEAISVLRLCFSTHFFCSYEHPLQHLLPRTVQRHGNTLPGGLQPRNGHHTGAGAHAWAALYESRGEPGSREARTTAGGEGGASRTRLPPRAGKASLGRHPRTPTAPGNETARHHRLKGSLTHGTHRGQTREQWQIEVTGGGRIWYLLDTARETCWITFAGTGPRRATDRH